MEFIRNQLQRPVGIAVAYVLLGVAWILVTDYLVLTAVSDPTTRAWLQTAKGWIFVGGSAIAIYGLVLVGYRRHEQTNEQLERAVQQTSVLHRLLRHNLRNNCNIIQGNVELLASDDAVPANDPRLEDINAQTDRLVELGAKTRYLRDAVIEGDDQLKRLDLAPVTETVVGTARERYPSATIEIDCPDACFVRTTPRLERALTELIDNAVEHNDRPEPTVRLDVRRASDRVELVVTDDGPGIPDIERTVLEGRIESPMVHSEGLGLWIARTIVVQADGSVELLDDETRGTAVKLSLPC